ncbi:Replication Factor C Subunit 1-related protein [Trypanosoma cruzi]|nr:Replication Factor C Subunit 1-related protein [Trypanosoma cruzi]
MSLPPRLSSCSLVHTVSLSAFFEDGFRLASSSSPCLSRHHTGDAGQCCTTAEERNVPSPCGGPAEYRAGEKRIRLSLSCTSTQDITPSSEGKMESADLLSGDGAEEGKLLPFHKDDASLLLEPAAASLVRLGPSGSWLGSPPRSVPEKCDGVSGEEQRWTPSLPKGGNETANSAELASLLHTALLECYREEDELLKRGREVAVSKKETRHCAPKLVTEEKMERAEMRHRPSPSNSSSSSGTFERMVDYIHAQKRRRLEQSERLEIQVRDIARVKELPVLVEDAVRYAQQLFEWSCKCGGNDKGAFLAEAGAVHSDESTLDDTCSPSGTRPVFAGSTASDNREANNMLYAKFPPPLFRTSSFAAAVGRLLRWVRTWQRAMPGGVSVTESIPTKAGDKTQRNGSTKGAASRKMSTKAVLKLSSASCQQRERHVRQLETRENSGSLNDDGGEREEEDDGRVAMASNRKKEEGHKHKRTALQSYRDDWICMADQMLGNSNRHITPSPFRSGSPFESIEEKEYGLATDRVIYDEYGNRLRSVRLAKKMAEERALYEEAQKAREQRRGYFARAEEETRSTRRALFDEVSDSGSDEMSDDSNEDVTNIAVLHGPCGVGKTAIVYLVAEILGYRVVEMNTSVRRCPKNIDRLFSEVTRSRRLSGLAAGKAMVSIEEELKKLKSEHAAALAAVSATASEISETTSLKKKKKKKNVISAKAVAAFFRPRVRAKSSEVILVDGSPTVSATVPPHDKQVLNHAEDCKYGKRDGEASVTVEPIFGGHEGTTRTLLLFEDADVILGDETMKSFYTAVRDLAQRSKVPIIVTISSSASSSSSSPTTTTMQEPEAVQIVPLDAAQVSHFFGKRTPFTAIEPMSRAALFAQLLVVAAVERGLVMVQGGAAPHREEKDEVGSSLNHKKRRTEEPMLPSTPLELVMVKDVTKFRQLADAIRSEVYNDDLETSSLPLNDPADVRLWLNRLQYLLLVEQWPASATSMGSRHDECIFGGTRILPRKTDACSNAMQFAGVKSHWDTQLGRVLRAPEYERPAVSSIWEWQEFQYAEEIAADINANYKCSDGFIWETRGSNNSNGSVLLTTPQVEVPIAVELAEVLQGVFPNDVFCQQKCKGGVESVDGVRRRCTTTTRERIDAFGAWWRRTKKKDAVKFHVAARSATAYEDLIGFSCLLQQASPVGKGISG